ncbi:Bug family tripartite tricarboxylate transporter substrate binding protein [Achromobacter denitrificans]
MKRSTFIRGLAGLIATAPLITRAQAPFPSRRVTIVVPYTPGGAVDGSARTAGEELARLTNQPFVILNKPGASTSIGAEYVKTAAKDGYTWLLGTTSTFSVNPYTRKNLGYRRADFEPLGAIAKVPYVLSITNSIDATTLQDFGTWARGRPQGFTFATTGQGTSPHIVGLVLAKTIGAKALAIHYNGSMPLQVDLIAGNVDASIDPMTTALPMHRAGKIRIIAVMDSARWPELPEVPTLAEQGVPDLRGESWLALFSPAGTDRDAVARIGDLIPRVPADAAVQKRLMALGLSPMMLSRAEFSQFLEEDAAWWKKQLKRTR